MHACSVVSTIFDSMYCTLPGSSPGGSREFEGWTALKIRLRNNSVVGELSGGRGLINLGYVENQ